MDKMSENFLFRPSSHQLKFAEIYLDTDKSLIQEKIAEEIGVADRTIRSEVYRQGSLTTTNFDTEKGNFQ